MSARREFDAANALYEEAVAIYEAAKARFEALETLIQENLRTGRRLTTAQFLEEERRRARLLEARVRLSRPPAADDPNAPSRTLRRA
jgi:hypothetical protein